MCSQLARKYGRVAVTIPLSLNFGCRKSLKASFKLWPPYAPLLNLRLWGRGVQSLSVRFGEEKNLSLLSGIEPYLFGHVATNSVNTPTHILGTVMPDATITVVVMNGQ